MPSPGIIDQTQWSPTGPLVIALLVVPFALNGPTQGLVLAAVVWVVMAMLLVRWWRGRGDPRPPDHAV